MRVLLLISALLAPAVASSCSSLPHKLPARVSPSCPSSSTDQITAELNTAIDSLLPQLQASLSPSPCEGLGWTQVANINSSISCPDGWTRTTFTGSSLNLCARPDNTLCASVFFSTQGLEYNQVCGMVRAYQYGRTEAFLPYNHLGRNTINQSFVDGVIITRGLAQEHVWTFASGLDEQQTGNALVCPCLNSDSNVPDFVGDNYFCESGTRQYENARLQLFADDPLWDGSGCVEGNTCCTRNNPPYFSATLPTSSCDDLEVRICAETIPEKGVPVELLQLYVK